MDSTLLLGVGLIQDADDLARDLAVAEPEGHGDGFLPAFMHDLLGVPW